MPLKLPTEKKPTKVVLEMLFVLLLSAPFQYLLALYMRISRSLLDSEVPLCGQLKHFSAIGQYIYPSRERKGKDIFVEERKRRRRRGSGKEKRKGDRKRNLREEKRQTEVRRSKERRGCE